MLEYNERILVDESGYKQFLDELEKLKNKSLSIATNGSESYKAAVGDGWHDNFDFEESMRESRTISARIDKMLMEEKKLKLVIKEKLNENIVNIGDTVKIEIIYSDDDTEIEIVTLTGKYIPNIDDEITLNSPLGRAIFKKKIDSINEYKVNDKVIKVKLIEKM